MKRVATSCALYSRWSNTKTLLLCQLMVFWPTSFDTTKQEEKFRLPRRYSSLSKVKSKDRNPSLLMYDREPQAHVLVGRVTPTHTHENPIRFLYLSAPGAWRVFVIPAELHQGSPLVCKPTPAESIPHISSAFRRNMCCCSRCISFPVAGSGKMPSGSCVFFFIINFCCWGCYWIIFLDVASLKGFFFNL